MNDVRRCRSLNAIKLIRWNSMENFGKLPAHTKRYLSSSIVWTRFSDWWIWRRWHCWPFRWRAICFCWWKFSWRTRHRLMPFVLNSSVRLDQFNCNVRACAYLLNGEVDSIFSISHLDARFARLHYNRLPSDCGRGERDFGNFARRNIRVWNGWCNGHRCKC